MNSMLLTSDCAKNCNESEGPGAASAGVTELPESIGKLRNLKGLYTRNNRLRRLPETFGKLGNLARLNVSLNRLRRLPATIGALEQLEVFDARWNSDLDGEIPGEFGMLQSLKSLKLTGTRICALPTSFVQLSRLELLVMLSCDEVQEVPELTASLSKLRISPSSLKSFPDLSSMTNMVDLTLSNRRNPTILTGKISEWIHHRQQKSSPMLSLSTGMGRLSGLGHLQLSCPSPSHAVLPSGLGSLSLYHSTSLSHWERLSNLDCLSTLQLRESGATEIKLDGMESLKNLAYLVVCGCEFLERIHDI
ncbi:hypothetical protein MLD38_009340 [Melastoma candidum]|uniref:Uncharacterized protein n=1 Tax=Melastoma candidum TaxID=119954 RepID=A0ACB9S0Y2_9MYRT|nr:hypothetical protein MLD38_009340 [Melastoma candidum]